MATFITSGEGTEGYTELASRPGVTPQGRLFRKHILPWGSFKSPNDSTKEIEIDKAFADSLVANFSKGVCDIVQVPLVNENNQHTEDPDRNLGRVVDVDYDDKGVFAYIDALKKADDFGKTLIGASAMMSLNYTDTRTGEKVGPTLLHCAVTNRPYITNLQGFDEVVSASADTDNETVLLGAVEPSEENDMPKTLEEILAELKDQHGVDVSALQATVAAKDEEISKLSAEKDEEITKLSAEKDEEIAKLSDVLGNKKDEEVTLTDVAQAVIQLSNEKKELETKVEDQSVSLSALREERDEANKKIAENEIDSLIKKGRILPKQREVMVELSMTDRKKFETLLPEDAIVSLSEDGVTTHEDTNSDEDKNKQTAVQRYLEMAEQQSGRKTSK